MTLISYAQNFEDVLLWRALGHIKNGFYIDAGANDPEMHSVTKAFYDAGWHGINIEPMPAYHQQFLDQRPRDINLAAAAGATESSITLYDIPAVNGWATTDAEVAARHRADGHEVTETTVPLRTLASICAQHVRGDIHFLKIDVEGFEGEVLRGMDFKRWRPWVVVVEATVPGSRETNHAAWEDLVIGQGYRFAWFDGLNRYYVADEHQDLLQVLDLQPNVFDDFISHHLDKAWKATERAKLDGAELGARTVHAERMREEAEHRLVEATRASQAASEAARAASESAAAAAHAAHEQAAGLMAQLAQAVDRAETRAAHLAKVQADLAELDAEHKRASAAWAEELQRTTAAWEQDMERARAAWTAETERNAAAWQAEEARLHQAIEYITQREAAALAGLQEQLASTQAGAASTSAWAADLEQRLVATHRSTSWRVTAPLRAGGSIVRAARDGSLLRKVVTRLTANERMRRLLIPVMLRYPSLGQKVSQTVAEIKQVVPPAPQEVPELPEEIRALPVSARRVLADLQHGHSS